MTEYAIDLLSVANRKAFLGPELYLKCERNAGKVNRETLQKRLNTWKDDMEWTSTFGDCTVDDMVLLCNLKNNPDSRQSLLASTCMKKISSELHKKRVDQPSIDPETQLAEANACMVCYGLHDPDGMETEPITLNCGHNIHVTCLTRHLMSYYGSNKQCAQCMKPITGVSAVPTETNRAMFHKLKKINREFETTYREFMDEFLTEDERLTLRALLEGTTVRQIQQAIQQIQQQPTIEEQVRHVVQYHEEEMKQINEERFEPQPAPMMVRPWIVMTVGIFFIINLMESLKARYDIPEDAMFPIGQSGFQGVGQLLVEILTSGYSVVLIFYVFFSLLGFLYKFMSGCFRDYNIEQNERPAWERRQQRRRQREIFLHQLALYRIQPDLARQHMWDAFRQEGLQGQDIARAVRRREQYFQHRIENFPEDQDVFLNY